VWQTTHLSAKIGATSLVIDRGEVGGALAIGELDRRAFHCRFRDWRSLAGEHCFERRSEIRALRLLLREAVVDRPVVRDRPGLRIDEECFGGLRHTQRSADELQLIAPTTRVRATRRQRRSSADEWMCSCRVLLPLLIYMRVRTIRVGI
jgi:hypothetical protein